MNPLIKIVPPVWFFLLLGAGLLVHSFVPMARVFEFSFPIPGIVLIIAGFVLSSYASALFSSEKTEILPSSETNRVLVTRGPYAYTRNPMYLGIVMQFLGVFLWAGSLPLLVGVALYFCIINFIFIPFEEAKLSRIFGADYVSYKSRVRRWI